MISARPTRYYLWVGPDGMNGRLPLLGLIAALGWLRQAQGQDPRLDARLDPATRVAVNGLLDSARLSGVPVEPLIQKALEGASKKAPGPRIAVAVRAMASELGVSRSVLGAAASADDIVAGAGALHAGLRT